MFPQTAILRTLSCGSWKTFFVASGLFIFHFLRLPIFLAYETRQKTLLNSCNYSHPSRHIHDRLNKAAACQAFVSEKGEEKSFNTSVQFMTVSVCNLQAIKARPGGGPKRQNAVMKMEINDAVPHCYPTR